MSSCLEILPCHLVATILAFYFPFQDSPADIQGAKVYVNYMPFSGDIDARIALSKSF